MTLQMIEDERPLAKAKIQRTQRAKEVAKIEILTIKGRIEIGTANCNCKDEVALRLLLSTVGLLLFFVRAR